MSTLDKNIIVGPPLPKKEGGLNKSPITSPPLFIPGRYFLGILQKSIKMGNIYRCSIKGKPALYLLPEQDCYFCSAGIEGLTSLFLTPPKDIEIKLLSGEALKKQIGGLKTKDLNDLLWYATITASQGRLMAHYYLEDNVYLHSWPDISMVSANRSYLIIASFMNKHTVSLVRIAEETQQKLSDVIDFHNGCYSLGLMAEPLHLNKW
ncbi:MAG: hypothetical protein Q9M50_05435 [Methylococcales bacterium]|nr:hypothetical protein [Methylococcales bacterium]